MTPNERAKYLFESYLPLFYEGNMFDAYNDEVNEKNAKAAGVIACDTAISCYPVYMRDEKKYWQEVKSEIEKI